MSLKKFTLGVIFWLPICFAGWYFSSIIFVPPLANALSLLSTTLLPHIISAVEPNGNQLRVFLTLGLGLQDGSADMLRFEINPLIYGYCVPLYTALLLASPGSDGRRLVAWLNAMAFLFLIQILGIQAEILKVVVIDLAGETQPLLALPAWGYEAVALVYQLSYLILPGVTPIGLWLFQFREFVMEIANGQDTVQT